MIVEANVFPYNKMFPHMKEQFVLEFTKVLRVLCLPLLCKDYTSSGI